MEKEKFEAIQRRLENRQNLSEDEVVGLSKDINTEAAGEFTNFRKEKYANAKFQRDIIDLAGTYKNNPIVLRNIISALGFISVKYEFFDDGAFKFIADSIDNKENVVRVAIAKNIYKFPQFPNMEGCWEYLLSVPTASPKKESIEYFYRAIKRNIHSIPIKYVGKAIITLQKYAEKNNEQYAVKSYLELIEELKGLY